MMDRLGYLLRTLRSQLALSPAVTGIGLVGVALGAICLALAGLRGDQIPPEGSLIETATFNGSLGIFVLTQAVLLPAVAWTARGRRIWTISMVLSMIYAYGIETVQAFRGLDPRFSQVAGPLDQALGGVFLLDALFITGLFVVLAVKFFKAPSSPVAVAVRYGAIASSLAFGVGIYMSATGGRNVGEAGNLLVLHAAGFHGLQAVPLVALFLLWAKTDEALSRRLVHVAGLTWVGACLAIAWQSGTGGAVTEISVATAVTLLLLLGFGVTAVRAARAWMVADVYGTAAQAT